MSSLDGKEFPIPKDWKHTPAEYFWAYQQHSLPKPFPMFQPGDIVFSRWHGFIGGAIALLDLGKKGNWSHVSIYHGDGFIAESTTPKGGINPLSKYIGKRHSVAIYRVPGWAEHFRSNLARTAGQMVKDTPYDYLNILRHALDFLPAALFGVRPFARWIKDRDGVKRMVCSEAVGWAYFRVAGAPIIPGLTAGQETPEELYRHITDTLHGELLFAHKKGEIQHIGWDVPK